ncbi:hypothetical protein Clacol_009432 [Clathrus columnatus]|uniref:Uncharacterized protein n=1 Tax=Clathrus columnatus TaxID=1419009 RepID=A0AAV5AMY9_9AGAM|nr:hypothetical protein Clacol_009432 [Clathrus columnatus]
MGHNAHTAKFEGAITSRGALQAHIPVNCVWVVDIHSDTNGNMVLAPDVGMPLPENRRAEIVQWMKSIGVDAVVGFTAPGLVADEIVYLVAEAIQLGYVYNKDISTAVQMAFQGNDILIHTGVIVMKMITGEDGESEVVTEELVWGALTAKPWGLDIPICPACKDSSVVKVKIAKSHQQIHLQCSECKMHAKTARPSWIRPVYRIVQMGMTRVGLQCSGDDLHRYDIPKKSDIDPFVLPPQGLRICSLI